MVLALLLTGAVAGCARQPDRPAYVDSKEVQKLTPDMKEKIHAILAHYCGTPKAPKLLGNDQVSATHLKRGADVYGRYCVQCHGNTGDGNGIAAVYMAPKPRDYRLGMFKFTSTTYGSKPLRDDLIRTVRRGVRGTSMPSFSLLPPGDLDAVVHYVLTLTHRGELEAALAEEAVFSDGIDQARVPEIIKPILRAGPTRRARLCIRPCRCQNSRRLWWTRGGMHSRRWVALNVMARMAAANWLPIKS